MTAWSDVRRLGLVAAVIAKAETWLLEPSGVHARPREPEPGRRPVVAVVGLAPRCGTSTVARALAVELARRDRGAAAVSTAAPPRVPELIDDLRDAAARRAAPVVIDVGHGSPPEPALALADRAVLVATPDLEPSLADVVAASLTRVGRSPLVVVNRVFGELGAWAGRGVLSIGESRLGARLALAGREPVGAFAADVAELADTCELNP